MFPVKPEKEKALREKLDSLNIFEKDIEETFVRSQGRGGQKVNKSSTCVHLKHVPTGTEVKCQQTRSQGLNRYYARVLLHTKIEDQVKGFESEEKKRAAKIKRQKRKRSKRAKEKVLREKKMQSEKKASRALRRDRNE